MATLPKRKKCDVMNLSIDEVRGYETSCEEKDYKYYKNLLSEKNNKHCEPPYDLDRLRYSIELERMKENCDSISSAQASAPQGPEICDSKDFQFVNLTGYKYNCDKNEYNTALNILSNERNRSCNRDNEIKRLQLIKKLRHFKKRCDDDKTKPHIPYEKLYSITLGDNDENTIMDIWKRGGGAILGRQDKGCTLNVLSFFGFLSRKDSDAILSLPHSYDGLFDFQMIIKFLQAKVSTKIYEKIIPIGNQVEIRSFFETLLQILPDGDAVFCVLHRPPGQLNHSVIFVRRGEQIFTVDPQITRVILSYDKDKLNIDKFNRLANAWLGTGWYQASLPVFREIPSGWSQANCESIPVEPDRYFVSCNNDLYNFYKEKLKAEKNTSCPVEAIDKNTLLDKYRGKCDMQRISLGRTSPLPPISPVGNLIVKKQRVNIIDITPSIEQDLKNGVYPELKLYQKKLIEVNFIPSIYTWRDENCWLQALVDFGVISFDLAEDFTNRVGTAKRGANIEEVWAFIRSLTNEILIEEIFCLTIPNVQTLKRFLNDHLNVNYSTYLSYYWTNIIPGHTGPSGHYILIQKTTNNELLITDRQLNPNIKVFINFDNYRAFNMGLNLTFGIFLLKINRAVPFSSIESSL